MKKKSSTAFKKEHGVSFRANRMVHIVSDMFSSGFLSGKSTLIYHRYIQVVKFLQHRPDILNIIVDIGGEEKGSRTLGT